MTTTINLQERLNNIKNSVDMWIGFTNAEFNNKFAGIANDTATTTENELCFADFSDMTDEELDRYADEYYDAREDISDYETCGYAF